MAYGAVRLKIMAMQNVTYGAIQMCFDWLIHWLKEASAVTEDEVYFSGFVAYRRVQYNG